MSEPKVVHEWEEGDPKYGRTRFLLDTEGFVRRADGGVLANGSEAVCSVEGRELARLAGENTTLRAAAETSIRKCEQYWNEHNIPDAEVHCALELIHGELRKALEEEDE